MPFIQTDFERGDMTVEAFIDEILEGTEDLKVGRDEESSEEKISDFWKQVNSLYSGEMMTQPLNKKTAARICHIFMKGVLNLSDVDWQEAAKLRDIYECRVCANAIAQVYERGIIPPRDNDVFGVNDVMPDGMIADIINSLYRIRDNAMRQ